MKQSSAACQVGAAHSKAAMYIHISQTAGGRHPKIHPEEREGGGKRKIIKIKIDTE